MVQLSTFYKALRVRAAIGRSSARGTYLPLPRGVDLSDLKKRCGPFLVDFRQAIETRAIATAQEERSEVRESMRRNALAGLGNDVAKIERLLSDTPWEANRGKGTLLRLAASVRISTAKTALSPPAALDEVPKVKQAVGRAFRTEGDGSWPHRLRRTRPTPFQPGCARWSERLVPKRQTRSRSNATTLSLCTTAPRAASGPERFVRARSGTERMLKRHCARGRSCARPTSCTNRCVASRAYMGGSTIAAQTQPGRWLK